MKNSTKISVGLFATILFLLISAFGFKYKPQVLVDKFGSSEPCNSLNKSANGTKTAYTQSAHDQTSPGTCSGCHSGGTTTPVVNVSASPAFGSGGTTYVPGTTYTISYQVTGYTKYGFDIEMNAGNTTTSMQAGTLSALSNTKYTAPGTYPANITQNAAISSASVATFKWVAPSVGTTVYFFSNGLGVNGNGGTSGDKEVFKNFVLTPAATLTLSCPGNQTINSSTSTVVPNIASTATASTTCAGGAVTKTQSPAAGTALTPGNNVVTVTATDNCGNTQTCTTTINYVVNTGTLTLSCPGNQTINSSSSTVVPNIASTATASTTCPGGAVTKTQSPAAGTALTPGNNVVTVTATDNCGNTQTYTTTINYVVNTGTLSLSCPGNQTINSSTSTVVPNIASSATASTTCPGGAVTKTQSPAAGTALTPGNNVITITATDNCNNTQTCTTTINYVVNTGTLSLTCPGNQTIYSSSSTVVPNIASSATASTSCPGGAVTKTQSPAAGTALTPGNNVITITATDNCNNTQTCTTTINYVINTGALTLTCPGNQTINSSSSTVVPNLTSTATATTSCPGGAVTITQSPAAGTALTPGNNVITITATDNCSNTQTCSTTINYVVNTGILTLSCPGNQTINSSSSTVVPNIASTATASTTCPGGTVTKTQSPAAGTALTPGNNIVTVSATDNCGNTQTCTTTINYVVSNTGTLSISCGGNQTIYATQQTTVPNLTIASNVVSTCTGAVTFTQSPAAGTALVPGNNVITITASDNCGNTQTCTSTINYINNNAVLSINCPGNQIVSTSNPNTLPNYTSSVTATTTCSGGVVNVTQSPVAGSIMQLGLNTVLLTVTDNCGNSQACQMTVNYTTGASVEQLLSEIGFELFPNPSKGQFTINYNIETESAMVIDLVDINGKLITNLINDENAFGKYSNEFNVNELNSGIYLIKIQSNGSQIFKKMIIE